ncbi:MAG: hypothetical protein AAB368_11475 [bacterium]
MGARLSRNRLVARGREDRHREGEGAANPAGQGTLFLAGKRDAYRMEIVG